LHFSPTESRQRCYLRCLISHLDNFSALFLTFEALQHLIPVVKR
jgi:hypothetical protein